MKSEEKKMMICGRLVGRKSFESKTLKRNETCITFKNYICHASYLKLFLRENLSRDLSSGPV